MKANNLINPCQKKSKQKQQKKKTWNISHPNMITLNIIYLCLPVHDTYLVRTTPLILISGATITYGATETFTSKRGSPKQTQQSK